MVPSWALKQLTLVVAADTVSRAGWVTVETFTAVQPLLSVTVIAEQHGVVDVLRWDRVDYKYVPQRWDLYSLGGFEPEDGEDDSPIHNAESEN